MVWYVDSHIFPFSFTTALSPPPAPTLEAVEPAAPKCKLAVLGAEHEWAKARLGSKVYVIHILYQCSNESRPLTLKSSPRWPHSLSSC